MFHGKRHPSEMGAGEVRDFLNHLAVERTVAASTQSQAKSALLFWYRQVLQIDLPWLDEVTGLRQDGRTTRPRKAIIFTESGDKAYDSDPLDIQLKAIGIDLIALHKTNRVSWAVD